MYIYTYSCGTVYLKCSWIGTAVHELRCGLSQASKPVLHMSVCYIRERRLVVTYGRVMNKTVIAQVVVYSKSEHVRLVQKKSKNLRAGAMEYKLTLFIMYKNSKLSYAVSTLA